MKQKNYYQIVIKFFKLLYYIVIVFVCLIIFLLIYYVIHSQINAKNKNYRPNISIYTIVSPSMTPVINVYDVVVNKKVNSPQDIEMGDILTYISASPNSEGMTVTHRVIEIKKNDDGTYEYLTQGDNNSEPDSLYVKFDQVIGVEIMIIPKIGKVQFLIANQKGWLILLLVPVVIYLLKDFNKMLDLFNLRNRITKLKTKEEEEKETQAEQEKNRKEELKKRLVEKNKYHSVILSNELDYKIKEYDQKLVELNQMLENIDDLVKKKEEDFKLDESYLKGSKIKVVDSYSTKEKIIKTLSFPQNEIKPKKLNLNPKDIKKINRPEYQPKKTEEKEVEKRAKKVRKETKSKVKEVSEKKIVPKTKNKIITIEKVNKKK